MIEKLSSRKLWVAILSICGITFGGDVFFDEGNAELIAGGIAAAYVIGQSITDAFKKTE